MLGASVNDSGAGTTGDRLIVGATVERSVLPGEDDERAAAEAARAALPLPLLARHGASVRQAHRRAACVVIEVPPERQAALASDLAAAGFAARPPRLFRALLDASVPAAGVPPVWRAGYDGSGVRIGVVDSGCDPHPDLAGRLALRHDLTGTGYVDDVGHGTHVSGIAAGAGAVYRGVAPAATLVVAKALAGGGGGEDVVLAALSWLSRQRVDVVNLSLGGPTHPDDPLVREVDALALEGMLVCVAAGNEGPRAGTIGSPGNAAGAITVGAADRHGQVAPYSSRGPVAGSRVRKPDLVAIGGGTSPRGACPYGDGIASARAAALAESPCAVPPRYVRLSGTSMACPHVAGVAALLMQAERARHPERSVVARASAVRRALVHGARTLGAPPEAEGAGMVDAEAALVALVSPGARTRNSSSAMSVKIAANAK